MRMARAFIASVPLAVVLVAAFLVPLAVIPGTFAFHGWPKSQAEQVTERAVRETPRVVQVVKASPKHPISRAVAATKQRDVTTRVADRATGPAAPRRLAADLVTDSPGQHGPG